MRPLPTALGRHASRRLCPATQSLLTHSDRPARSHPSSSHPHPSSTQPLLIPTPPHPHPSSSHPHPSSSPPLPLLISPPPLLIPLGRSCCHVPESPGSLVGAPSASFYALADRLFNLLWVVTRFFVRSTRCDRHLAWYAFPAHAATPHTNHHSTLTHPPANPSLPLADLPQPPHGVPTRNHPVEAPTPPQSCLTQPHPVRRCVPTVPTPCFPHVSGHCRRASGSHETPPG